MAKQIVGCMVKFAILILAVDLICFAAWKTSGQVPQDGFYFGAITNSVLTAIQK